MHIDRILKFAVPLLVVVFAMAISQFFSSFRTSFTPRHWAADVQYTHLAITERFQQGETSFWTPKTYNLNPDGGSKNTSFDGVCDARFPIVHYIIAKCTKNLNEQIVAWRAVSALSFILSILFIYLIINKLSTDYLGSFIAAFGLGITAQLVFAQDTVGTYALIFAQIIMSFYFYVLFLKKPNNWSLYLSFTLLSLASLQGHGTILLFVIICGHFLSLYVKLSAFKKTLIYASSIVFVCLIIFGYQRLYLFKTNGGIFELNGVLNGGVKNIIANNAYFLTNSSGLLTNTFIGVSLFFGVLFTVEKKYISDKGWNDDVVNISLLLVVASLLYTIVYMFGLTKNSFYFLESLSPTMVILAAVFISLFLRQYPTVKWKLYLIFIPFMALSFNSVFSIFKNAFIEEDENRVQKTLTNFKNAKAFLDKLGIPKTEKISIINGYADNLSLLKTGRLGYAANGIEIKDIVRLLNHDDSKYVLSQDQFFMFDVVNAYPKILSQLQLVASNEVLSLYKKKIKTNNNVSNNLLLDYVIAHNKTEYVQINQDFENVASTDTIGKWNLESDILPKIGYASSKGVKVKEESQFPCTYTINLNKLKRTPVGVVITAWFYTNVELRKVCFNTSCHSLDKDNPLEETQNSVESFKVSKKLKGSNLKKWTRVSCKVNLPKNLKKEDFIKVYVWNPNNASFLVDDFSFIFY